MKNISVISCCAILLNVLAGCGSSGPGAATEQSALDGASNCVPATAIATPIPDTPVFALDPMGPLSDVTCDWKHYQPAAAFCVKPDAPELTPGGTGPLSAVGSDPECAFSGFAPDDKSLFLVRIDTPILCPGCRRFFVDLSMATVAHGHVFYAIASFNPTYTIDPIAHSPNTKNFTNDYLVSPPGTPLATLVHDLDQYFKAYVTDTDKFAHTGAQGPYYIGPWYVNREGERIHGLYVDVDVADAQNLNDPNLNALRYLAGYNSGTPSCPDNLVDSFTDFDLLYFGCNDRGGTSSIALNPFP